MRTYKAALAFLLKVEWSFVSYRFIRPSVFSRRCCLKRSGLTSILYNSTAGTDGTLCAPAAPSTYSNARTHTPTHANTLSHTCAGVRAHTHTSKCLTNAIPGTAFQKEYQSIDSWKIWSGGPNKDNEAALVSLNNFIFCELHQVNRCYRVRETVKSG